MIDKSPRRAYLRAMKRGIKRGLACGFLGFFLLLALAGQIVAGAVQDGNPGRYGQTLDLKSLPVKGKTTVVDCYSPFCPPCMRLAPLLEELAQKRADLVIKKVNIQRPEVSAGIDWQAPLAKQLGIRSVPHFRYLTKMAGRRRRGKRLSSKCWAGCRRPGS